MKYTVSIVTLTGKKITESRYPDLPGAKAEFIKLLLSAAYERVLIVLVEHTEEYEEKIVDVDFVDGLAL